MLRPRRLFASQPSPCARTSRRDAHAPCKSRVVRFIPARLRRIAGRTMYTHLTKFIKLLRTRRLSYPLFAVRVGVQSAVSPVLCLCRARVRIADARHVACRGRRPDGSGPLSSSYYLYFTVLFTRLAGVPCEVPCGDVRGAVCVCVCVCVARCVYPRLDLHARRYRRRLHGLEVYGFIPNSNPFGVSGDCRPIIRGVH